MSDCSFKLGEQADILVGQNTRELIEFYQKIGFSSISKTGSCQRMTDGSISIALGEFGINRYGLVYYTTMFNDKLNYLQKNGIDYYFITTDDRSIPRCINIKNQEGINLFVAEKSSITHYPEKLIMMKEENFKELSVFPNQICGIFGEFSVPVIDLTKAILFWQKLGYQLICQYELDYPWAILRNDINILGFHQNINYKQQAVSYFANDMENKIQIIKKIDGLILMPYGKLDELSKAAVLLTPNNQQINLFTL